MSDNLIAILGLAAMAAWVIVSCWRYHWKWEAFERGERLARVEESRDALTATCKTLTAALRENDLLCNDQARKSLVQQERIAELEGIAADRLRVIECLTADSLNVVPIKTKRARATGDGVRL